MKAQNKHTILLVDDDPLVLEAMHELFCDEFVPLLAKTGVTALEFALSRSDIAAVVLDVKMAGQDGVETYRQLREARPQLPIVIHTGFPGSHHRQQIDTLLSPFAYIIKGRSYQQLIDAVRQACGTPSPDPEQN